MREEKVKTVNGHKRPLKAEKERKRLISYKELSHRIIVLTLCLYLAMAGGVTWSVAADVDIQIQYELLDYLGRYYHKRDLVSQQYKGLPGSEYASMINQTTTPYQTIGIHQTLPIMLEQMPSVISSSDWYWGKWDMLYGFEAASLFCQYEGDQKISLFGSGNYLAFTYTVGDEQGEEETRIGYVDLDQVEGDVSVLESFLTHGTARSPIDSSVAFSPQIYMKGYFEGNQFYPHIVSYRDNSFGSSWTNLLSVDPPADRELQKVQGVCVSATLVDYEPFTVAGKQYSDLPEFLSGMEEYPSDGSIYRAGNLWNTVFVSTSSYIEDANGTFDLVVALRCWPLPYTMLRLIPFYLVTFALVAVVVHLILRRIREKLTRPLEIMVGAIGAGVPVSPSAEWKEPRVLQQYIEDSHQERSHLNNEIQRLNTALTYAKDAEENRRQLISHLTHELKTPLAVIHSYAEGLQAGIAEEKKDQYLAVILEETEKMDAMVLQMLDLSRLEAGKVKLATDQVSLIRLTQSIMEKFAPMMREKGQELICEFPEDFSITADEARIGQAITNLVSNAYKYTPAGGKIRIKMYIVRGSVHFTIENTSAHLTEVALKKIWDSFYRVDPARTEPGTGLGLTLVKSIVELHRGSCIVRNTMDGSVLPAVESVEFGFVLPGR